MDPTLPRPEATRFALGLTQADVEEFQAILREECGEALDLPAAWARATQTLSLFHYFLRRLADSDQPGLELTPDP